MQNIDMKKITFLFVFSMMVIFTGFMLSSSADAQMRFGVEGCFGDDVDFGIGARLTTSLGYAKGLGFIGSFDYFFPDFDIDYFEINGLVTYTFTVPNSSFAPYAGGGVTLGHASAEWADASDTEIMPSLLGGFKLETASGLSPFFEFRIELSGYEQFVITGGVLF